MALPLPARVGLRRQAVAHRNLFPRRRCAGRPSAAYIRRDRRRHRSHRRDLGRNPDWPVDRTADHPVGGGRPASSRPTLLRCAETAATDLSSPLLSRPALRPPPHPPPLVPTLRTPKPRPPP